MSGEFGDYNGGYLHEKISNAADDCARGSLELTRKWGEFLEAFYVVAKAVSWVEACDSSEPYASEASTRAIPELRAKLDEIEAYLTANERGTVVETGR